MQTYDERMYVLGEALTETAILVVIGGALVTWLTNYILGSFFPKPESMTRRRRIRAVGIAIAILAACTFALIHSGRTPDRLIAIKVVDNLKRPVPGALVRIDSIHSKDRESGSQPLVAVDSKGTLVTKQPGIEDGDTVVITATHAGSEKTMEFAVHRGDQAFVIDLDIDSAPLPSSKELIYSFQMSGGPGPDRTDPPYLVTEEFYDSHSARYQGLELAREEDGTRTELRLRTVDRNSANIALTRGKQRVERSLPVGKEHIVTIGDHECLITCTLIDPSRLDWARFNIRLFRLVP